MVAAPKHQIPRATRVVGPGFHRRVYQVVSWIPVGYVSTYGDIATVLGSPQVARHVGFALAALHDPTVPWHRVINARGAISFKGDLSRAAELRQRLQAEGVCFGANDRIDLSVYRCTPGQLIKGIDRA